MNGDTSRQVLRKHAQIDSDNGNATKTYARTQQRNLSIFIASSRVLAVV